MQMNIDERLAKYLKRDFSLEQAQILVLMEEAAIALFAALPEHFVCSEVRRSCFFTTVHGYRKI